MALFVPGQDGAPLALLTLGVVGDDRPFPDLQPKLKEGIHLRWAFQRNSNPTLDRGFPWYGFYLLRRPTPTGGPATCVASQFGGLTAGPLTTTTLNVPLGTFESDQNLVLTDDFSPTGTVELDLSGRSSVGFKMPTSSPKRRVDVKIGFVSDFPPTGGDGPGNGDRPGGGLGDGGGDDPGNGGTGGGQPGGDPSGDRPGGGLGDGGGGDPDSGTDPGGGGGGELGGVDVSPVFCACGCGARSRVQPIVERVISLGNGTYLVTYGYRNPGSTAISLPLGPLNGFSPSPASRGQPTLFLPGTHHGVFTVIFNGGPLTWNLGGIVSSTSSASAVAPTATDGILVTAFRGLFPVAFRVLTGRAGDIVTASLTFEAIDRVTITAGPARLIDICAVASSDSASLDWAPVPNFPQPMLLPVSHAKYPLNSGAPNVVAARALAKSRISYAFPVPNSSPPVLDTSQWDGDNFATLHELLIEIVQSGPTAGITDLVQTIPADPDPSDPSTSRPEITSSSLNLLLLGASNPAVAQMLGLYWVDDATVEGQSYDYLLVADNANAANGNIATIQALVAASNFTNIDAYRCSGVTRSRPLPLAPPGSPEAYALPVAAVAPPAPADSAGLVGLRWQITDPVDLPHLTSNSSFLFHLWRRDFGLIDPINPVTSGYTRISDDPFAPSEMRLKDPPQAITGWPTFGLFAVDGPLVEGYYGYCINGIDIFGRYSALSQPARWLDVETGSLKSAAAVHLIDTTPPPPPTRVQAWVLDPADQFLIKDTKYIAWRASLGAGGQSTVGLRVRWSWPGRAIEQAPDTREFRIYVQAGAALLDAGIATNWSQRVAIVRVDENIIVDETVAVKNGGGTSLTGASASVQITVNSNNGSVERVDALLSDSPALDGVPAEGLEIELAGIAGGPERFTVLEIDAANKTVRLDRDPNLAGVSAWTLFHERTYELFLPGTSLATPAALTLPTVPTLTAPVAQGLVGVSAADDKQRNDPRETLPNPGPLVPRLGNEGDVGGPAGVYQVWRQKPAAPTAPYSQDKLLATRADFKSRSFFTLHFVKSANVATDVYRALDETLFRIDAEHTTTVRNADVAAISAATLGWFTAANAPDTARLQAAAAQVTAVPTTGYAQLSNDALRLLASLASNAPAFTRLTTPSLPASVTDERGLSDSPTYDPNSHPTLGGYTDTLDGRAINRYFYRTAYVDLAQNQGLMGPSTPPVYLPPTALPDAPILRRVTADANLLQLNLAWGTSRSPDVTEYRIYRTDDKARTKDVRLMELVHTAPELPLAQRPASESWADTTVKGLITYFYRIVAVVGSDHRASEPSTALGARAVDAGPPPVPALNAAWIGAGSSAQASLSWTSSDETLLQERPASLTQWLDVGDWRPPGTHIVSDPQSTSIVDFQFRLLVRKYTGAIARGEPVTLVHLP